MQVEINARVLATTLNSVRHFRLSGWELEGRPILGTISVEIAGGQLLAAAADGFMLGARRIPVSGKGSASFLVPFDAVDSLRKFLGKPADGETAVLTVDGRKTKLPRSVTVRFNGASFSFDEFTGKYPDIRKLTASSLARLKRGQERTPRIALNPDLLGRIVKAMKDSNGLVTRWYFRGDHDPCAITWRSDLEGNEDAYGARFLILLMPMYVNWGDEQDEGKKLDKYEPLAKVIEEVFGKEAVGGATP